MSRFALIAILACCAACRAGDKPAETPTPPAPPPGPAPISLADLAGEWTVRAMPEGSDSTVITYTIRGSADPSGWTITLPERQPMAMTVAASGDSVIADVAPFESALRKGVRVTTHAVMRLQDGKLIGTTVAHYSTAGPDSVTRLRTEGTRKP